MKFYPPMSIKCPWCDAEPNSPCFVPDWASDTAIRGKVYEPPEFHSLRKQAYNEEVAK